MEWWEKADDISDSPYPADCSTISNFMREYDDPTLWFYWPSHEAKGPKKARVLPASHLWSEEDWPCLPSQRIGNMEVGVGNDGHPLCRDLVRMTVQRRAREAWCVMVYPLTPRDRRRGKRNLLRGLGISGSAASFVVGLANLPLGAGLFLLTTIASVGSLNFLVDASIPPRPVPAPANQRPIELLLRCGLTEVRGPRTSSDSLQGDTYRC